MLKSGAVWKLNRTWLLAARKGEGKRRSERAKQRWANPEFKKRVSALVKKAHNKPEVRKKRSDDAKKRWADPEFKKRVSDAVRKGVNRYYAKQKGMVA